MATDPPHAPLPVPDTEESPALAIHPEDPDDEWMPRDGGGRVFRVRAVTGGLLVLALLGGGFWGGVVAEKHHGNGSSSSSLSGLASRLAALRGAGTGTGRTGTGGAGGLGFGGTGGRNATVGTVIDVQGNTIDISDSSGNLVKVIVGPSTTITRTSASSAADLKVGDTVVVGGTSSGGTLNATTVRASAQGVTTLGGGGFGGSGGASAGSGAGG